MLSQRVVCFFLLNDKILLGRKKKGFGEGKYVGIGGKIEKGESKEECVFRESLEEVNVTPTDIEYVVTVKFLFPEKENRSKWDQEVHVFKCRYWNGTIEKSDEIEPVWFENNKIPYDKMWDDAKYWLPDLINNEKIENVEYVYDQNLKVYSYS